MLLCLTLGCYSGSSTKEK